MGERKTPRTRKSFSNLPQILEVPNLIAVQTESFEWFKNQGLKETIEDINPIEDYRFMGRYPGRQCYEYKNDERVWSLTKCR